MCLRLKYVIKFIIIMKTISSTLPERGILTSTYKQEIRENISETKRATLSKMKTIIENHHNKVQSQTGTILQVSLFAIALVLIVI